METLVLIVALNGSPSTVDQIQVAPVIQAPIDTASQPIVGMPEGGYVVNSGGNQ